MSSSPVVLGTGRTGSRGLRYECDIGSGDTRSMRGRRGCVGDGGGLTTKEREVPLVLVRGESRCMW